MWVQIRGFIRAFFRPLPPEGVSYSLAKTLKESMHIRGGDTAATASRTNALETVAAGHENYTKSFEKRERPR